MPYIKCVNLEQEKAIEELKDRMKKELTSPKVLEDDAIFYKYLKAQEFNVDKAEKSLRKHIVWRKVYDVDNILKTFKPKEVFLKYVGPSLVGFDKDGDIVIHLASGRINTVELLKCIKMNDCMKHLIWFAEKHKKLANETGKKISVTIIFNLDRLEFSNATSKASADIFLRIAKVIRDNYAERLKAAYIINAPPFYMFVFMLVKAIMPTAMVKRLHAFGQNGWKEKLLEAIDADLLPAFLGGKRTDPDGDPYCRSFITIPGKIPDSLYSPNEERYFENPSAVTNTLIRPSEKKEIFTYVEKVGSVIRWRFMVGSKTICFGLFFQESEKAVKEIIPIYEYDTSDGTEENSHQCLYVGNYITIFDNSHSKFSSKEVQYVIHVERPET